MNPFPISGTPKPSTTPRRPVNHLSWRSRLRALCGWPGALLLAAFAALPAWAQNPGANVTNAFGSPASNIAHAIRHISWTAFWIIIPFIVLAEVLLVVVIFKFRRRPGDNRRPAKFYENAPLEITWTVLPLIAVGVVALMGFHTLKFIDYGPAPDMNVMVVGHRFFWEYRYPQYGIDFSNQALVVPAGRNIDLNVTSVDVIHGFYVPALGLQMDAVPGRISHLWFRAKPGTYQGQCAQLCGPLHGEMFLTVKALPPAQFVQWLNQHAAQNAPGHPPVAPPGVKSAARLGPLPSAATPPAGHAAAKESL
ncbi:MAG: cytochrome c oxidase subunit II [Terriglobales bacterium]